MTTCKKTGGRNHPRVVKMRIDKTTQKKTSSKTYVMYLKKTCMNG